MSSPVRTSPLALTVLALLHYQPLHPYGVQRLIKQWGKDQVVNVGQRASLYRTIERLRAANLITVQQTERDQLYPERTVYEITHAGRAVAHQWLREMLSTPRQEFPEFPAALSYLLMLTPRRRWRCCNGAWSCLPRNKPNSTREWPPTTSCLASARSKPNTSAS